MNFLFLWVLTMIIGGAYMFGHEFGYEEGARHERQRQGYRFQEAKPAFAEITE